MMNVELSGLNGFFLKILNINNLNISIPGTIIV